MQDELNISVAKIVATPSSTSWAQAYNAGRLFAVISLSDKTEEKEKDFLNILGKDTVEALEQEYYSLEIKDLSSTKSAFEKAVKQIPENVEFSFAAASIVKNVIYIFYSGEIRVSIKRGGDFANLVDSLGSGEPQAISGEIKDGDILIIQSKEFKQVIPTNTLMTYIDNQSPDEIAEAIAPAIHKDENSGASAIILKCSFQKENDVLTQKVEGSEMPQGEIPISKKASVFSFLSSLLKFLKFPSLKSITHSRKLILTIAIVIAIILASTVFFAINKQNEERVNALFETIYKKAELKYIEGEGLIDLNKNLAKDSFEQAYKILNDGKDKFPKDSDQEKKILSLLDNIEKNLQEYSPEKIVERKDREKISLTIENGSGIEGAAGEASDFLKEKGYTITETRNAENYNYEESTINVKNSVKIYGKLIEEDLSEEYDVSEISFNLSEDTSTDAVIIIGKKK